MTAYVGRHRPPLHRPMSDIEIDNHAMDHAVRHIGDGHDPDHAWELAAVEATDMLVASRCAS